MLFQILFFKFWSSKYASWHKFSNALNSSDIFRIQIPILQFDKKSLEQLILWEIIVVCFQYLI